MTITLDNECYNGLIGWPKHSHDLCSVVHDQLQITSDQISSYHTLYSYWVYHFTIRESMILLLDDTTGIIVVSTFLSIFHGGRNKDFWKVLINFVVESIYLDKYTSPKYACMADICVKLSEDSIFY